MNKTTLKTTALCTIRLIACIIAFFSVLALLSLFRPAFANPLDRLAAQCEQLHPLKAKPCWEEWARLEWRQSNGDLPPDLTEKEQQQIHQQLGARK